MATLCRWTETKSYGDVQYRIEKLEDEKIAIQQDSVDGWVTLESFSKGRLIANVLEKLGSDAQRFWDVQDADWPCSI